MAKKTVLQFVNESLDLAESEQVAALDDSVESVQILGLLNQVLTEISLEYWWEYLETDVTLTGLTTTASGPFPIQATVASDLTSIEEIHKKNADGTYVQVHIVKDTKKFRNRLINATPSLLNEPTLFAFQSGTTVLFNDAIVATYTAGNFYVKGIQAIPPFAVGDEASTLATNIPDFWDILVSMALKRETAVEIIKDGNTAGVYEKKYNQRLTDLIERGVTGVRDINTEMEMDLGRRTYNRGYVEKHCPTYFR